MVIQLIKHEMAFFVQTINRIFAGSLRFLFLSFGSSDRLKLLPPNTENFPMSEFEYKFFMECNIQAMYSLYGKKVKW